MDITYEILLYYVVFLDVNKIKAHQICDVQHGYEKALLYILMLTFRVRYLQAGLSIALAT